MDRKVQVVEPRAGGGAPLNNPYVERSGLTQPKMFQGRAHELQEIADYLRADQSVSIVGPRRIGKSSLLQHFMRESTRTAVQMGPENLLVYQDCAVLADGPETEVHAQLCMQISTELSTVSLEPEPALNEAVARPAKQTFRQALRKLKRRGLRVVLILDEFEQLVANPVLDVVFYNAWRSVASNHDVAFLTASARPLHDLTQPEKSQGALSSPFFNIFPKIPLGLLDETEARSFIRTPMEAAGIAVTPRMEDFIYRLAGGHPLALQIACYHAWDGPEDLKRIEKDTVEQLAPHFKYYWENLSPAEQRVLRNVPRAASKAADEPSLREVLRALVHKCLLVETGGSYKYASEAWAEYVKARPKTEPEPNGGSSTRPSEGCWPTVKRVLIASLPEAIGGLAAALVGAIVYLVLHPDDPSWRVLMSIFSPSGWPIWVLAGLGALAVGIAVRRRR